MILQAAEDVDEPSVGIDRERQKGHRVAHQSGPAAFTAQHHAPRQKPLNGGSIPSTKLNQNVIDSSLNGNTIIGNQGIP
jgi:hypothetical protein